MKKIIVVGYRVDKKRGYITGQAVMIDLFINIMKNNKFPVKAISLNYILGGNTKIGKTSFLRLLDYLIIFTKIIFTISFNPKSVLYFSPVSNKFGSIRDYVMVKIAKFFGYQIIMQQFGCRFQEFYNSLSPYFQKMVQYYYSQATIITVEGEKAKEQFKNMPFTKKLVILQNGLPETNLEINEVPKHIDINKPIKLFYLSNMIESKGYMDVLEAIDILVNQYHKNIIATFAGKFLSVIDDEKFKSPEEASHNFTQQIERYGLKEHIKYFPSLFGKEKANEWNESHFFLLPTYYVFEGQPTAILEALAYGTVPVVTRHGLIPEMVNEKCCIFVEKKNPKQIAERINNMIDNPNIYTLLSKEAFQNYQQNYTLSAYENKLLNIIKQYIQL